MSRIALARDPIAQLRADLTRPEPPDEVAADVPERTVPDAAFARWIQRAFVAVGGPLENDDHAHLLDARIGVVWTNIVNVHQQRTVVASAEIPMTMGNAWKRGRAQQQLRDWFGEPIDFLLTFQAQEMERLDDRAFCAVVEHELYHCAQKRDQYGDPVFDRMSGRPAFAIRGHDAEEFVGVVRRYGAGAAGHGIRALIAAAARTPEIADVRIDGACGTCHRQVA